jgi:Sulfotransferase domain
MSRDAPIDVVAIAGTGQNGGTLASRLMGEFPGWVAVGEIARVWDKGLSENIDCSCGEPFGSCPFWTKVGEVAFGGWDALDAGEARRLLDSLLFRGRRVPQALVLPLLVFPRLSSRYARDVDRYVELSARVFAGVLEVSGADTVLDSSKWPVHVYSLARARSFHTRVIHLVRDARGVAYSNTKEIVRQGARTDRPFRVRQRPWKLGVRWMSINLSSHVLRWLRVPVLFMRYESLVVDPRSELARAARFAGVEATDLAFLREGEASLPAGHLVAGNRMRLERGPVPIRLDDAWQTELPDAQRRLVSLITWPLLRAYGYVGSRRR